MGRNGVGKTTTLKAIVGLVQLDTGVDRARRQGLQLRFSPEPRARPGIGYVPQGRDIFPQSHRLGKSCIGARRHKARKLNGEVDRVFELFPVLKEMLQRKGGVLSGGQQQQLAIGRALLTDPKS